MESMVKHRQILNLVLNPLMEKSGVGGGGSGGSGGGEGGLTRSI